jgi:hypothetical protein
MLHGDPDKFSPFCDPTARKRLLPAFDNDLLPRSRRDRRAAGKALFGAAPESEEGFRL